MQLITSSTALAERSARQRRTNGKVAFVPTMGALHEGHLALVRAAKAETGFVVASVFVNPLQFNNKEDLAKYPRDLEKDRRLLEGAGCDVLYAPTAADIFHGFTPRTYDLGPLDDVLEGPSRPGHFQGMINVVERLFHYARPDVAFFGEKDRQQLAVIRHVAHQQHWPERIVGHPTVREADGLAMSSRNQRLSSAERTVAPVLYRALEAVRAHSFRAPVEQAREAGLAVLAQEPSVGLDYLAIAHPTTLAPLTGWSGLDEAVALIAAQVGPVRLIDNITLRR